MINVTLPALLAPGNLPALAKEFKVEVALVTESKFFQSIRDSAAFQKLGAHSDIKLVSIDDLLTGLRGDYGPVLTFSLIRGYSDLGQRMTDYFLMFLNADFILADGSYRTVARLIKDGHQVIHCPSFRGVLEEIMPELVRRTVDGVLAVPPREMVALALQNKHITVKARTINQKLCYQKYMDQFYWYVDEETLVGYQWPIALVGLRPERIMTEPKLMFDYGFIPEICPTAKKYYIGDSDDFFMLEPQSRDSGQDLVRLGWTTPEDIASYLTRYATVEHRECGQQMHVFHSAALPDTLPTAVDESKAYMRSLVSRLGPPLPHNNHPVLTEYWRGAVERIAAGEKLYLASAAPPNPEDGIAIEPTSLSDLSLVKAAPNAASPSALRRLYWSLFGHPGRLKRYHPRWLETHFLSEAFFEETARGSKILWISGRNSLLVELASKATTWVSPSEIEYDLPPESLYEKDPYDACMFDLSLFEALRFRHMYNKVRRQVKNGGRVYLNIFNKYAQKIVPDDAQFCETVLPDKDTSSASFFGNRLHRVVRLIHESSMQMINGESRIIAIISRSLRVSALIALAPLAYLANRNVREGHVYVYRAKWLLMTGLFKVVHRDKSLDRS